MSDDHDALIARYTALPDDRCGPRTRLAIPATLRWQGGRGFASTVRDLSISGFCAASATRLRPGTRVWLTLPGLEGLPAQVVWWDTGLTGCAFDNLLSPVVHDALLARWRAAQP